MSGLSFLSRLIKIPDELQGTTSSCPRGPGTKFWHRLAEGVGQLSNTSSFTLALPCNRAKVGQSFALGWGQEGWDKVNFGGTTRSYIIAIAVLIE